MNTTAPLQCFFTLLGKETPLEAIPHLLHCHGSISCVQGQGSSEMFLLHASTSLSFLLLLIHLCSLLLIKLFTFLSLRPASKGDNDEEKKNEFLPVSGQLVVEEEDLVADIIHGGEDLLFCFEKSANIDTVRVEQGSDSTDQNNLEAKDATGILESVYSSPLEDFSAGSSLEVEQGNFPATDTINPSPCPSPIISWPESDNNAAFDDEDTQTKVNDFRLNEEKKVFVEEKSNIIEDHCHSDSKKLQVDEHHEEDHREHCGESLTTESTSKSSVEWRSSTIFRDSETEYPFSSSSRRSSSRWESYAVFRKYDEEMLFFDRISAQKLSETESFRSIKVEPRSISQRIVHKLTTKHRHFTRERRDPYQELESAYVAQICLTWEALNWNYNYFRQANSAGRNMEDSGCPAKAAQQFQQFQVLLQRFIENEPYERGRRPETYARMRISFPKLLQVPEFRDTEGDENKEDLDSRISSEEFLKILEDTIRTFMDFLQADKESHCQVLKALIKKKPASGDQNYLNSIKKVNKKKKHRLRDLRRQGKCLRKRKLKEEGEMEILMGLIDMKVVSRVLRMPEISEEQLHWCEEKMTKVRIWDGKMQRDPSPLFFPVH